MALACFEIVNDYFALYFLFIEKRFDDLRCVVCGSCIYDHIIMNKFMDVFETRLDEVTLVFHNHIQTYCHFHVIRKMFLYIKMRVDLQIAPSSNYLFPNTNPGDVIFKTADSNVGVHFGSASSSGNAVMSLKNSLIKFGCDTMDVAGGIIKTTTNSNIFVSGINVSAVDKRARASKAAVKYAMNTWAIQPSVATVASPWRSICWSPELGLFVAVASANKTCIMISSDGMNWTLIQTNTFIYWRSVIWSPELSLFVVVANGSGDGSSSRVMTSSDGRNWTFYDAFNQNWNDVCWSPQLSLFVAVASSGVGTRVMTSPDGVTWTLRNNGIDNTWRSVCWSPELSLFVAVASSGTGNRVMTSRNGIDWSGASTPADNDWGSVCWSPDVACFVAVAGNGVNIEPYRVMTSYNGTDWTLRSSVLNGWQSVSWSPEMGIFITVSDTGTGNRIMTSYNGIDWTTHASPADSAWKYVCWSPELSIFVSVGLNIQYVMRTQPALPAPKSTLMLNPSHMSISSNGYVGIGTSNPSQNLHVVGNTLLGGHVIPTSNIVYDLGSSNQRWRDLFLSGSTINLGGTVLTTDSSNNFMIMDSNNNFKKIIASELQMGTHSNTGIFVDGAGQIGLKASGTNVMTLCNNLISLNTNVSMPAALNLKGLRLNMRDGTGPLNVSINSPFGQTGCNLFVGLGSNFGIGTSLPTQALEVVGKVSLSNSSGKVVLSSSNNNLGINMNNPVYPLDINGDLNFSGALRQNGALYQGSQWSTVGSNVIIVSSNVGIGLSNPSYRLDVMGDVNFTGNLRQNGVIFSSGGGGGWVASNTSNLFSFCNVGVGLSNPQYPIHVTNSSNSISIYATGDVVGLSDERLKTNFAVIPDAMSKIKNLNGYTFQYISDPASNMRAGLIAQEVLKVFPEVVSQDNNGYYNLAYGNMAALMLNAIKELNDRLEKIESMQ